MLLIVILSVKMKKTASWDQFYSLCFTFGHVTEIILFMLIDRRLAAYYAAGAFILWMVLKQPRYNGPSNIVELKNKQEFIKFIN
jgi:hypothetical protein